MNKINLMDNLIADPFTIDPKEARKKSRKSWPSKKTKKEEPEIKTIVMCGCGNHPINPKKDPYKQHNNWASQFHPKVESSRTDIRGIKGVGYSAKTPAKNSYDFSGEEFEVTNEEMRKTQGNKDD
jgi:hypothetical protein